MTSSSRRRHLKPGTVTPHLLHRLFRPSPQLLLLLQLLPQPGILHPQLLHLLPWLHRTARRAVVVAAAAAAAERRGLEGAARVALARDRSPGVELRSKQARWRSEASLQGRLFNGADLV